MGGVMATEHPDPKAIIRDLKEKRQALEQSVGKLREDMQQLETEMRRIDGTITGLEAIYTPPQHFLPFKPIVAPDDFADLTIVEAAKRYLDLVPAPVTTRELWEALASGGVTTTSTNPTNNLLSILKARGDLFTKDEEHRWSRNKNPVGADLEIGSVTRTR
jgi:hypothetical protein